MSAPVLTEAERKAVVAAARAASRRWKGSDPQDLEQELWVWALSNLRHLARWRDEENGKGKLGLALRRAADGSAGREASRAAAMAEPSEKGEPLSPRQVKALLSVVWAPEEWPKPSTSCHPVSGAPVSGADPERVEVAWAMLHDLAIALERLAPLTRRLLWLRYRQGLSAAETAEILGLSAMDVDTRASRAVARLGRALA